MSYEDNVRACQSLWADLREQYTELEGIRFNVNPRLTARLGRTRFTGRSLGDLYRSADKTDRFTPVLVEVAAWVVKEDVNEALDTVLHEAAHALAGHQAAHGPRWQAMARQLGASDSRCNQDAELAKKSPKAQRTPKWSWTCPTCGCEDTRLRRPSRSASHVHCRGGDPITWTQLR